MADAHQGTAGLTYARVRASGVGAPSAGQLELLRGRVHDPAILDEHEPFVWRVAASTDAIDSYYTRMDASSLRNFAEDARAGVAYLDSHVRGEQPLGMSFDARYVRGQGERLSRTEEDFYTLRGLDRGQGLSTDAFIDLIRSGISRDVSIGFIPGWYRCSVCDRDMFPGSWEKYTGKDDEVCKHFPGLKYPVTDKKGNPTGEEQTAYAWVMDAHQAECSSVFDGATPGAMVTKAQGLADGGLLKPDTIRVLEARLRVNLGGRALAPLRDRTREPDPKEGEMDDLENTRADAGNGGEGAPSERSPIDAMNERIDALLRRSGAPDGATVDWLADELARLRPLADDGRAYRAALVAEAIEEGVRAFGDAFALETQRARLEGQTLDQVRIERDAWAAIAKERFPSGRATKDEAEPAARADATRDRPDIAYQS